MKQKTFSHILIQANDSHQRIHQGFEDKRLTHAEKQILKAYLLVRDNKNDEAEKLIKALPLTNLSFVDAQKNYIIGVAQLNQSNYSEAENYLTEAALTFKQLSTGYFEFMAYYNLCLLYCNARQLEKMHNMIFAMEPLQSDFRLLNLRFLRCKFDYYVEKSDSIEAKKALDSILPFKDAIPESDMVSQLVSEFIYYTGIEDFSSCYRVLAEMKNQRKFHLTENFNFMKKLLDHLTKDAPIYLQGNDFSGVPVLFHELNVIIRLEENDKVAALKHWEALARISSELYKSNFEYTGTKCLFSLCLDKHLKVNAPVLEVIKGDNQSHFDALVDVLLKSQGPLSKTYLYEYLWGETIENKEDLKKLTRLISRIRSEKGIEVISRKGTYFIERKPIKKKIG